MVQQRENTILKHRYMYTLVYENVHTKIHIIVERYSRPHTLGDMQGSKKALSVRPG